MIRSLDLLSRRRKALVIMLVDSALVAPALYTALALRTSDLWYAYFMAPATIYMAVLTLAAVPLSHFLGIPRTLLRMFDTTSLRDLAYLAAGLSAAMAVIRFGFQIPLPRSLPGIFFVVYFAALVGVRLLYLALLGRGRRSAQQKILIYGAGAAGQQLFNALRHEPDHHVIGFVDDKAALWGSRIGGARIHDPAKVRDIIAKHAVDAIVLAIPSAPRQRRIEVANRLIDLPCQIKTLPSFAELISGEASLDDLRPVTLDRLLGRDAVQIDLPEVRTAYRDRVVMVTGAGGSIGSELCRTMIEARPARLVLFEVSEYALYTIERELGRNKAGVEIVPVLGSVLDPSLMRDAIRRHGVEVVLHAAAYKHVPLVEINEVEGVRNNVLGTASAAEAAEACGVERFILVSTDKAVRPTNVMGASKRLAELVVQDLQTRSRGTRFSMVRFGNVIGSSGSVIPLFREQIARGGPVTLTDPEVTRYFMTIFEAAQLVMIAGAMSQGGEVFVLDMGEPVRIADLARSMIQLSGRSVREPGSSTGDIEIRVTGLRPGEKLYEELLIDENTVATPHPKIMVAREAQLADGALRSALAELERAIAAQSAPRVRQCLARAVADYKPASKTVLQKIA